MPTELIEQHRYLTHYIDIIFLNEIPMITEFDIIIR